MIRIQRVSNRPLFNISKEKDMSEEKEVLTEEVFTPQAVEDFGMVGIEKLMGVLEGQEE